MPADGDDTAALVVADDFLAHGVKGHAVEVLGVAHLDAAQLEAHHGRPVAAHVLHVAAVFLIRPGQSVERVVLMAEHIPLSSQAV